MKNPAHKNPKTTDASQSHILGSRALSMHWDRVAQIMPDILPAPSTQYYRQMEINLIQRHFGSLQGKRVLKLDLWNEAVNTRIMNWMASQGARSFGLDISFHTAYRAKENAAGSKNCPHFLHSDIQSIPYGPNTFEYVYTMGTIEHIRDYEAPIREIARVLKPGGKAIIGVPHKWDVFLRPLLVRLLSRLGLYLYAPERSLSANELRRSIERCGLRVLTRTGLLLMPGALRMADLFLYSRGIPLYRMTPLLLWPFAKLELSWPAIRKFGYLLTMVAEKPKV